MSNANNTAGSSAFVRAQPREGEATIFKLKPKGGLEIDFTTFDGAVSVGPSKDNPDRSTVQPSKFPLGTIISVHNEDTVNGKPRQTQIQFPWTRVTVTLKGDGEPAMVGYHEFWGDEQYGQGSFPKGEDEEEEFGSAVGSAAASTERNEE